MQVGTSSRKAVPRVHPQANHIGIGLRDDA
jgi:hypothetical protein